MFDGRRSRRGCLLPIVVALVAAMVCAFGSASMSATAESEGTSALTTELKVTNLEKGVKGTAYKYMKVEGEGDQDNQPKQHFESPVINVVSNDFASKNYIKDRDKDGDEPTKEFRDMDSEDRNAFTDKLLSLVANDLITLTSYSSDVAVSGTGGKAEISFTLPVGGYVIKLTNGSDCIYTPILADVWLHPNGNLQIRGDLDLSPIDAIAAKSEKITSKKTVDGNKTKTHSQIGEALNFRVETPIPKYLTHATNKHFGVEDHPDCGLTIKPSSIKVQIGGKMLSKENKDYSDDSVSAEKDRGSGIRIEFNTEQYNKSKLTDAAESGESLIVEYEGRLNDKASIEGGGTRNHARPLIVKDNYDPKLNLFDKYTNPPETPAFTTLYTYGVKLTKVDSKDESRKLGDAEFELYKKEDGTTTEIKVKKQSADPTSAGQAGAATGMYVVQEAGSPGSVPITSNAEGLVQIDGLNAGVTYILKETKAPEGYSDSAELVTTEIIIRDEKTEDGSSNGPDGKPDLDNSSMIGGKAVTALDNNRLVGNIENKSTAQPGPGPGPDPGQYDFTLPKTGAMGTAAFSAIGVALVAGGVALVVVIRRRKVKHSS
ncbi:SpaH/EbpB family LPXTG-anchored major pilin [Bifidobacterium panos]|uniref:Gram-positive pilin backbone subunit 2, Cna-B-like domain-containing protein n=1 Tax=Bifidobacterium panos TaxID=2675321 RepID=A0ABX1SZG2_9BIFI|nr:SpaH/EbpB family LPXTG-anchored major pilin [Bifidobacterium sp. DSM 109963]NMN01994.1 Gram-positive pilin backbone subunit 2, Cna-B-like domain-containing protein [Bifidobacterium sp. DSM 109963]